MKKLLFATAICAALFSCSKSDDSELPRSAAQVTATSNQSVQRFTGTSFDNYYLLHNPTLDVFYNDVQNNQSFYFSSARSQEKEDRGYATVTNYLRGEVSADIDSKWLDAFFAAQKNCDYRTNQDFQRITRSSYYTQLSSIIDHDRDIHEVREHISVLIANLQNDRDISDSDKVVLKSSMLIGGQSFEYWTNENVKWQQLGARNGVNKNSTKTNMMHADVEGAVSGAITGAITGAPFAGAGAGAGALCGAMLGAAWGSAVSGAFSHFGIW